MISLGDGGFLEILSITLFGFISLKGGSPSNNSTQVIPKDHISVLKSYLILEAT